MTNNTNRIRTKTINDITRFLFIGQKEDNLAMSDLVIVLGNDEIEATSKALFNLYQKGIINEKSMIILSGANGALDADQDLECNRLYDCAVYRYDMPSYIFVKEPNAKNARQNFEYSKGIIESFGGFEKFNSILCIGKAFFLRRASMYALKFNYPEEKMQFYGVVDDKGKNIGPNTWWQNDDSINRVMAEIERIGKYYSTGDLSIFAN